MDVQGSSYHLINGVADWGRCIDTLYGETLALIWAEILSGSVSGDYTSAEYDGKLNVLHLRRDTPLFRRAGRTEQLNQDSRRGAGRDSYGNWFWIGDDRRSIAWRPEGGIGSSQWWSVADETARCTTGGTFTNCVPPLPADLVLQGLTVTTGHYLLAGYLAGDDISGPAESGLLVFDLQAGGPPARMIWPAGFVPWDLADTPDGGALVLDAANAAYYQLDAQLRQLGQQPTRQPVFQPETGCPLIFTLNALPAGAALSAGNPGLMIEGAVSIEPGPDGSVLVLESSLARGYSILHRFDQGTWTWSSSMIDVVEVIDPADPNATPRLYSLFGHDFVYLTDGGPLTPPRLYIADAEGKQVLAFSLDPATGRLTSAPDFLPMREWAGRALVRAGGDAWYDFHDRWIPLAVFTECRFESALTLITPIDDSVPGAPFDSQLPGCVWHRLLLDAQIPTGTGFSVRARASDDPALLAQVQWLPQPVPYLRSGAPELPWYDPWADRRDTSGMLPDQTGTWELLFQQVTGRYLQIELSLAGNGRSSPLIRSVRAWYPRFSYPEHYLPAIYPANDSPDAFLERFLANFEGIYTAIEEQIEHSHLLLDARTTPAPDLEWLASWFGLVLDPQWTEQQRRFLVRYVDRFYRWRGTVCGLAATINAYLQPQPDEHVFCSGSSGAGQVRIVEHFLTRQLCATPASTGPAAAAIQLAVAQAAAHRFDILVPTGLDDTALAMIQRIAEATRPAHTWYDILRYFDLFVVGQARLGLDTTLGDGPRFTTLITGQGVLASGYLGFPYPYDIPDRIVADRDRVGAVPQL